jgi:ankyrin repeat protein
MRRIKISTIAFALLMMTFGCRSAIRSSHSQQTEALLRAASAGNADTVRTLLTSPNVDVNGVDDQGNTALILAARFGHNDVVRTLLLAKADTKVKNKDGKTALMLAAEGGHDETVAALTQAGVR